MPLPPIYVSTGAVASGPLQTVLAAMQALNVERIELGSGLPHDPDSVRIVKDQARLMSFLIHNYFPSPAEPFVLNLAAADDSTRERSIQHCRECLDLTAAIGAPFYAAHAGFTVQPRADQLGQAFTDGPSAPRSEARTRMLKSVSSLLDHARSVGTSFLIENNVVAAFNARTGINDKLLLAEPDEMLGFAKELERDEFGYLIDTGHLKVSARTLGFDLEKGMEMLLPLTRAFHLSDNDGSKDNNRPFDRNAWFLPYLSRAQTDAVVIEAYNISADELQRCHDAVTTAWES